MALAVPICGDQDGSELPLIGGCPDYIPFVGTGIVQVPGSGTVSIVFDFVYRDAAFNNELGVIKVDDINGSINGINPGEPSYFGLALQRAWVAFPSGSYPNSPDVTATFNGGDYLMFFLIQNDTLSNLKANNPNNSLYRNPIAFFPIISLNPDGTDHLKMFIHKVTGLLQLTFEDTTGGGDRDFNDFVFDILIPGLQPVDDVPPTTEYSIYPGPNGNGWHNSDVLVTLMASDDPANSSGIKEIHYNVNSSSEVIVPDSVANIPITSEGINTISYWAVDKAGNTESPKTQTILVDKTGPNISIISPVNALYLSTGTITINFTASDELSGIDIVNATLDQVQVLNGQTIILSDKADGHTFLVTAFDKAGNLTVSKVDFTVLIGATVDIKPDTLNIGSMSDKNAITAYIEFANGYDVRAINVSTVKLIVNGVEISAQLTPTEIGDYNANGIIDRMVKFNRYSVIAALGGTTGDIDMYVNGELYTGLSFTGRDRVRVIKTP